VRAARSQAVDLRLERRAHALATRLQEGSHLRFGALERERAFGNRPAVQVAEREDGPRRDPELAHDARQRTRDVAPTEAAIGGGAPRSRRIGPLARPQLIELARAGDPVDDATALWAGKREHIRSGTLELVRLAPKLDAGDALLAFDPTNVADGIELSDDPILRARGGAYRRSGAQRLRVRLT
jgi:catalase